MTSPSGYTPWLDDGDVRLYHGDALDQLAQMPSESVQCIVTSPPFWGLRDYGTPGQIGLEETPDEWCARLVAVMREARRVLRNDGVCWLECGDTYASGGGYAPDAPSNRNRQEMRAAGADQDGVFALRDESHSLARVTTSRKRSDVAQGCKPKDLVGAPWLLAFALRADGWYLRSDTIWARPNPMPESVTDRPTKAHSCVFLLTKSARYFYDADAIREENTSEEWYEKHKATVDAFGQRYGDGGNRPNRTDQGNSGLTTNRYNPAGRNARSVWSIATEPTPFAHFATFPQALVERCIKAGTSEHGACAECGAPWRRITERELVPNGKTANRGKSRTTHVGGTYDSDETEIQGSYSVTTTGWDASCSCTTVIGNGQKFNELTGRGVVPCVVLDPFMGSGTTALVARRLGRHAIGIELNAEYLEIAARRLQQLSLLA